MSKLIKYYIIGQLAGYLGIGLSLLILPAGITTNDGVSYFGAHWETVGAFGGGLLIMTACAYRIFQMLPKYEIIFRSLVLGSAVLLFGLAVTPFGSIHSLAWTHERLTELLFVIEVIMVAYIALFIRRNLISLGMLALVLGSAIWMMTYWAPDRQLLLVGELITEASFSVATLYGLLKFAPFKAANKAKATKPRLALASDGFTIIELTIATTVFSMVLLLLSYGLIQIGRSYNKGVTTARTQEAARSIVDEITRSIQFSGGTIAVTPSNASDGTPFVLCIDEQRYSVVLDRQVKDSPQGSSQVRDALVVDTYPGCNASSPVLPLNNVNFSISSVPGARELLPVNMRLATLSLTNNGSDLYYLTVRVVAGEDDILDAAHDNCANVRTGTQFCAVSELSTVVQKRL